MSDIPTITYLKGLYTVFCNLPYPVETIGRLKDVAGIITGAVALRVSYGALMLSKETARLNKTALAEGIRPILDLDFDMDARDTSVRLSNKGLGVAVIKEVCVRRFIKKTNEVKEEGRDPFRMFGFRPSFNWKRCKVFSEGKTYYLPPKESFVLFHIDEEYLLSQKVSSPWINENSILDICHLMHHLLGEMLFIVQYENARGQTMPAFEFDCRKWFPLPDTPDPRLSHSRPLFPERLDGSPSEPIAQQVPVFAADATIPTAAPA